MSHQSNYTNSALTVLFDGQYWVGLFEKTDEQGYSIAKYIFGREPSDEDIYELALHGCRALRFTQPVAAPAPDEQRMSYKRRQRDIERLLAQAGSGEKVGEAQTALRAEQEAQRQARAHAEKAEREAEEQRKYQLRQEKRREKRRGH